MLMTVFMTALLISAIGLYTGASAFIAKYLRSPEASSRSSKTINLGFSLGWGATLAHLTFAYYFCFQHQTMNFSLGSMTVLISGLLSLIFVLGGLNLPIRRLGIIVFPLVVVCLLFSQLWGKDVSTLTTSDTSVGPHSPAASFHIVISILAYCLLAIAAIQSMLYQYQERQIKQRATPAMLMALPPLLTMEQLLFRLIWTGFILLTFTLLSGVVFSHEIFGKPFEFKHHTILASLSWLVFAILLIKRVTQGLRGSQAVYWTIGGFVLIQLGYFGTKIVSESLAVQ